MCAFIKRLTYWWVISIVIGIITATTQNEGDSTSQYLASYVSCQRDIQRLVGILQRQRQTEDLCFHSSLHSHWFLFSRSSRLP